MILISQFQTEGELVNLGIYLTLTWTTKHTILYTKLKYDIENFQKQNGSNMRLIYSQTTILSIINIIKLHSVAGTLHLGIYPGAILWSTDSLLLLARFTTGVCLSLVALVVKVKDRCILVIV